MDDRKDATIPGRFYHRGQLIASAARSRQWRACDSFFEGSGLPATIADCDAKSVEPVIESRSPPVDLRLSSTRTLRGKISPMSKLTPEERKTIERRLADVAARMAEMQPTLSSTVAPEWVDLYKERAQLEQQLKADE
jgi:hypothetical protein